MSHAIICKIVLMTSFNTDIVNVLYRPSLRLRLNTVVSVHKTVCGDDANEQIFSGRDSYCGNYEYMSG